MRAHLLQESCCCSWQYLYCSLLQGWVGYAIGHMLPTHATWPFVEAAHRWRLSEALLRIILSASRCPAPDPGTRSLSSNLAAALSLPGAASSCLASALPPDAGAHPHLQYLQEAAVGCQITAGALYTC